MLGPHAFFSFTSMLEHGAHRAYNEWHQLDHRPENLALAGVRHGERWVRTPAAAERSFADARLAPTHYVNCYWFAPPVAESVREWQALAERSFQWGRRQDVTLCTRPLMGFFDTVKTYVAPRVRVSAEALPYRPHHGVLVHVLGLAQPHAPAVERLYHRYDSDLLPAAVADAGVAGAYVFSSVSSTIDDGFVAPDDARTFAPDTTSPGALRVHLLWCDDDVHEVHERVRARWAAASDEHHDAGAAVLFDSALEVIQPWRWDWFDAV